MKITVIGVIAFTVLVGAFFWWIGGMPFSDETSYAIRREAGKAWIHCAALFIAGAGTACFGDKEYGMFPPTSLRWLYILFGVLIMVVSGIWMHSMKTVWGEKRSAVGVPARMEPRCDYAWLRDVSSHGELASLRPQFGCCATWFVTKPLDHSSSP